MTISSSDFLSLVSILRKADLKELEYIGKCCEDEFIIKYNWKLSKLK